MTEEVEARRRRRRRRKRSTGKRRSRMETDSNHDSRYYSDPIFSNEICSVPYMTNAFLL